jgi:hypothetical protein
MRNRSRSTPWVHGNRRRYKRQCVQERLKRFNVEHLNAPIVVVLDPLLLRPPAIAAHPPVLVQGDKWP